MFEQIKKKCPKGWEKFKEYDDHSGLTPLIGHLFTFFDSVGIYIELTMGSGNVFTFDIIDWISDLKFRYLHAGRIEYKSRPEAWQAAIPKAFEIYEKILEEKWI